MIKKLSASTAVLLLLTSPARATFYGDATNDLLSATSWATHLDFTGCEVTNDATNISFTIYLAGDPVATSWGEYQIGINLIPGWGGTNGTVPNGRPITMSVNAENEMDYWVRSWNGGAETYHWDGGTWYGDNFTWAPPSDIQVPVRTTNSVTLTTTLASLGLVPGDSFYFDVSSSGGTPTDSAVDALANPLPTAASDDWVTPYDSITNVYQYTVVGPAPVLTNAHGAAYSDTIDDLLETTAIYQHLNIAACDITNDETNITFTIYLEGDPIISYWGEYNIGIDSIPAAGPTSGTVPPARPISMSEGGMDYWIRSWDSGTQTDAEAYHWDAGGPYWALDHATYNPPSDIQAPVKTANSVAITTTLASLGLSPGSSFYFDIYASGGSTNDSAIDALANPIRTFASGNWVAPYDSGTQVYQYTVPGGLPEAPTLSEPQKSDATFTLSVTTQAGYDYVLEYKDALTDPSWTPVATNSGTGSQIIFTNTGATVPSRFYRVSVQ